MHINTPNGHKKARKSLRDKFSCKIIDKVHNRRNSLLRVGFWLWAFKTPQPNSLRIRSQPGRITFHSFDVFSWIFRTFMSTANGVILFVITGAKTRKIHHFLGLSSCESVSSLEGKHVIFGDLSVTWLRVNIPSGKRNCEHVVRNCRSCEAHVEKVTPSQETSNFADPRSWIMIPSEF